GGALTLRDVPKGTGHIDRAASPPGTFQKSSPLEKFRKSKYKEAEYAEESLRRQGSASHLMYTE
ncbi:MAG: hypothetical protein J5J00_04215, partial [Deltaproteobacteria bacterium]|nr:hypothetical protein [Deltaproteobacteria bacterium]